MARRQWLLLTASAVIALPILAYGVLAWRSKDSPAPAELRPVASAEVLSATPGTLAGTWTVSDSAGFVGYRIRERLGPVPAPSDAVGRSSSVEGSMTIEARRLTVATIAVDMTKLHSDVDGRDAAMTRQGLETEKFPKAEFSLSSPVDIGDPKVGRPIEFSLHGELTLHGATRPVVVPVQARWDGDSIQVAGSVRIAREDFGIDVSGLVGFRIENKGTIEFELTFIRAGAGPLVSSEETIADQPFTPTGLPDDPPCRAGGQGPARPSDLLFTGVSSGRATLELLPAAVETPVPIPTPPGADVGDGAWSPDGRRVAFVTFSQFGPPTLALVNTDGTDLVRLGALGEASQPDWSPDGTRLVYVVNSGNGGSDIWVAGADGSGAQPLTTTPAADTDPRWLPDGRHVVFTAFSDATNDDVMIVDADGQGLRVLVGGAGYEYSPSVTPDGTHVLFVRDGRINRVGIDGSGDETLSEGPNDARPSLSHDGATLVFLRSGNLYVAAADGSTPSCLPVGGNVADGARWRP
jgi:polyisoprenoid-binding protein YceI